MGSEPRGGVCANPTTWNPGIWGLGERAGANHGSRREGAPAPFPPHPQDQPFPPCPSKARAEGDVTAAGSRGSERRREARERGEGVCGNRDRRDGGQDAWRGKSKMSAEQATCPLRGRGYCPFWKDDAPWSYYFAQLRGPPFLSLLKVSRRWAHTSFLLLIGPLDTGARTGGGGVAGVVGGGGLFSLPGVSCRCKFSLCLFLGFRRKIPEWYTVAAGSLST